MIDGLAVALVLACTIILTGVAVSLPSPRLKAVPVRVQQRRRR